MKILYVCNSYVPSQRAGSIQVMKTCSAMARLGHEVTLVAKAGPDNITGDVHQFYGVSATFEVSRLSRFQFRGGGALYAMQGAREVCRRRPNLVYSRDAAAALLTARGGHSVVFECHGMPSSAAERTLIWALVRSHHVRRWVFISEALRKMFVRTFGGVHGSTIVAHDAADGGAPPSRRAPWVRASPVVRVGYVGGLYPGRGIQTLLAVAEKLPNLTFEVFGGHPPDVEHWQRRTRSANVRFHGYVQPHLVRGVYDDLDMLLAPYDPSGVEGPSGGDISSVMSPLKVFEYMSTGLPVLLSDLPVLREIADHLVTAYLVPPGQVDKWVEAVLEVSNDADLRCRIGKRAFDEVGRKHTWDARTQLVLDGL